MPNITGLVAPAVGASKTTYAGNISDSFTAIDNHDHSSGKGTQVPTGGLVDSAVTTAKILNANVTAAKLASDAVTTAKVLDANITRPKLADLGQQLSSTASAGVVVGAETENANLTVTITTTGRPVFIGLIPATSATVPGSVSCSTSTGSLNAIVWLKRGGTKVYGWSLYRAVNDASDNGNATPPSACWTIDPVAAGTYVYQISSLTDAGTGHGISLAGCKLVAFEIG